MVYNEEASACYSQNRVLLKFIVQFIQSVSQSCYYLIMITQLRLLKTFESRYGGNLTDHSLLKHSRTVVGLEDTSLESKTSG